MDFSGVKIQKKFKICQTPLYEQPPQNFAETDPPPLPHPLKYTLVQERENSFLKKNKRFYFQQ